MSSRAPTATHTALCLLPQSELAVTLAAMLLQDGEQAITSDALAKVIKASGNKVDAIWSKVFAEALDGRDAKDFLKLTRFTAEHFSGERSS